MPPWKKYDGKFICVVEGAIATNFDGGYGKVGGKTFLEIAKEVVPKAAATICIGACACFGGVPAAAPNPGGYKGVGDALGIKTLNIAGCPPNPINLVGTVVNYLLLGKLPALDDLGRPLFAYGKTIHDPAPAGRILKTTSSWKSSDPKRPPWATACTRWAAGSGNLQQLPHCQVQRRHQLAGGSRASLHRVQRTQFLGQDDAVLRRDVSGAFQGVRNGNPTLRVGKIREEKIWERE
jgi:hypothetical protein